MMQEDKHYTVGDALVLFVTLLFSEIGLYVITVLGLIWILA